MIEMTLLRRGRGRAGAAPGVVPSCTSRNTWIAALVMASALREAMAPPRLTTPAAMTTRSFALADPTALVALVVACRIRSNSLGSSRARPTAATGKLLEYHSRAHSAPSISRRCPRVSRVQCSKRYWPSAWDSSTNPRAISRA